MIDAQTTFNQIAQANNGANRLVAMVGAKHLTYSEKDNYIAFKFMRGAKNKANYVKVTLNAADTYDVEFGYIRGMNYTVRKVTEGLYNDMLKEHFETETGLYLSI